MAAHRMTIARIKLIGDRIKSGFAPASDLDQHAAPYQPVGVFRYIPATGGQQASAPARLGPNIPDHKEARLR